MTVNPGCFYFSGFVPKKDPIASLGLILALFVFIVLAIPTEALALRLKIWKVN